MTQLADLDTKFLAKYPFLHRSPEETRDMKDISQHNKEYIYIYQGHSQHHSKWSTSSIIAAQRKDVHSLLTSVEHLRP